MYFEPHHPVANASVNPPAATLFPPPLPYPSQGKYCIRDASDERAGNGNHLHIALIFYSLTRPNLPPPLPPSPTTSIPSHNGYPPYAWSHPLLPLMITPLTRPRTHTQNSQMMTIHWTIYSTVTMMMMTTFRHPHLHPTLHPSTPCPSSAPKFHHNLLQLPWTSARSAPKMLMGSGIEHVMVMETSSQTANKTRQN